MEKKKWGPCLKVKVTPVFLSLCLSRFLSLGAVKIMDCHAKWPDTRGQRGSLGGGAGKGGGNCRRRGGGRGRRGGGGGGGGGRLDRQGGGQTDGSGMLPSQFIPYYYGAPPKTTWKSDYHLDCEIRASVLVLVFGNDL